MNFIFIFTFILSLLGTHRMEKKQEKRQLEEIFQYIPNKMQRYTVYFIWKLLYMFRVVLPPVIRSAYNCMYSIWYLSHRYCYLPLSWKSWNWFECAVMMSGVPLETC
jgi:hypothetical protein